MKATALWGGLALLALLTFHQNRSVWTSEVRLWTNAARWAPHHPRPWVNLGRAHFFAGDQARARAAWLEGRRAAASPRRTSYEQWFGVTATGTNLAFQQLHLQQYPEALAELDAVLAEDPHFAPALNMRALARLRLGDCRGAHADWTLYRAYSGAGEKGMLPPC